MEKTFKNNRRLGPVSQWACLGSLSGSQRLQSWLPRGAPQALLGPFPSIACAPITIYRPVYRPGRWCRGTFHHGEVTPGDLSREVLLYLFLLFCFPPACARGRLVCPSPTRQGGNPATAPVSVCCPVPSQSLSTVVAAPNRTPPVLAEPHGNNSTTCSEFSRVKGAIKNHINEKYVFFQLLR